MKKQATFGGTLIMTLAVVIMFVVIFSSLAGLVSRQFRAGNRAVKQETAFQIAEAGLNDGRWRLVHNDEDTSTLSKDVSDPFGGVLGSYEVTFEKHAGAKLFTLTSVGVTNTPIQETVTLEAQYGIPSVAQYALVSNENLFISPNGEVAGKVHANGGVRMDGQSDSSVTSAVATYVCPIHHGCALEEKPGVWGSGEDESLWDFPVAPIDYAGMILDFIDMKSDAQTAGSYYGPSDNEGYHIVFNDDNTYTLYEVLARRAPIPSYLPDTDFQTLSHDILTELIVGTYTIPAEGIILVEDDVWIEGEIRSHVTLGAAVFPDHPSTRPDIILNGDISYGDVRDGTRMFAAISQGNIYIPFYAAEEKLELDGAYIAQHGRVARRHYVGLEAEHITKDELEVYGMIASNQEPIFSWEVLSDPVSGYIDVELSYDPHLLFGPPPLIPDSGDYALRSWEYIE